MAKLISNGTTIPTTINHEFEKEAIESVYAKKKITKSAWKVGVGPVFRKKRFLDDIGSSIVSTIFKQNGSTSKSGGFTRK